MARAIRQHRVVNPARSSRRRRNVRRRRHMTAKQIKFFCSKRQKAALKSRRRAQTNPRVKRSHSLKHRAVRRRRSNPGEILELTLGNPARRRRRKSVAATRRRRTNRRRHVANAPRRRHNVRRRRHNPAPVMRRRRRHYSARRHNYARRRQYNPAGLNLTQLATDSLFVVGGLVGSRLLTQMVLGAGNVGVWGYVWNAATGGVLAWLSHMMTKNPRVAGGIVTGTAAGIAARLLQDYTPFGTYLQQAGFGDYGGGGAHGMGLYLPANYVVPQAYTDALHSAQVRIPNGWAPTVQVTAPAATKGVGGFVGGGYSLY
jgi:hypothetical protein